MNFRKSIPYFIAIATFIIVSLVYFHPVLEGKKIVQSDIQQFIGMSKEVVDYRKANDAEPYWTNAAFITSGAHRVGCLIRETCNLNTPLN